MDGNFKPGDIVPTAPSDDGNRRLYLVLPDGRQLPLPLHYRPREFGLPGNVATHVDGNFIALFDDTTRTGAIYDGTGAMPYWVLIQPTTREVFFKHQVVGQLARVKQHGS